MDANACMCVRYKGGDHTRLRTAALYTYIGVPAVATGQRRFRISDPCPAACSVVRQNRLGGRPARLVQCTG